MNGHQALLPHELDILLSAARRWPGWSLADVSGAPAAILAR